MSTPKNKSHSVKGVGRHAAKPAGVDMADDNLTGIPKAARIAGKSKAEAPAPTRRAEDTSIEIGAEMMSSLARWTKRRSTKAKGSGLHGATPEGMDVEGAPRIDVESADGDAPEANARQFKMILVTCHRKRLKELRQALELSEFKPSKRNRPYYSFVARVNRAVYNAINDKSPHDFGVELLTGHDLNRAAERAPRVLPSRQGPSDWDDEADPSDLDDDTEESAENMVHQLHDHLARRDIAKAQLEKDLKLAHDLLTARDATVAKLEDDLAELRETLALRDQELKKANFLAERRLERYLEECAKNRDLRGI